MVPLLVEEKRDRLIGWQLDSGVGTTVRLLKPMAYLSCFVAVLSIPVFVLLWATKSRSTRINRLKKTQTWKQIGQRYGVSPSTVRRWAIA